MFVVRHQYQRGSGCGVEVEQQFDDGLSGAGVEIAGRFIGEQQRWPGHERARQCNTLLFATGQLARIMIQASAESDLLEYVGRLQFNGPLILSPSKDAQLQRQHHVLQCGKRRQ